MKKITSKKQLILYACSGLGVNMLNIIVGSYLCSAMLVGGFEKHVENWTYLNKDLVVSGLWAISFCRQFKKQIRQAQIRFAVGFHPYGSCLCFIPCSPESRRNLS